MHIGIDLRSLVTTPRTGVGRFTAELTRALGELDTQNSYYALGIKGATRPPELPQNWRWVELRYANRLLNGLSLLPGTPTLDRLIARQQKIPKLDLFISPNPNFTALGPATRSILIVHDLSFILFPEFFNFKQRWWHRLISLKKQLHRASLIVTPSEHTKQDLCVRFNVRAEKVVVLYPGAPHWPTPTAPEKNAVKIKYGLPEQYILYLGALETRKNIIGLIAGFEEAQRKLPKPTHLVLAGPPGHGSAAVHAKIASSPYQQYIHQPGYIEEKDLPALLSAATIFMYPSLYEGFGFPVLEAMASGVPVITSSRASLAEVGGNAVYYINPLKPQEIAAGLARLIASPELRQDFIKKGLAEAKRFNWNIMAAELLTRIRALTNMEDRQDH